MARSDDGKPSKFGREAPAASPSSAVDLSSLPEPVRNGLHGYESFYFTDRQGSVANLVAIFTITGGEHERRYKYMAIAGRFGVLFEKDQRGRPVLKAFDTPNDALQTLRRLLGA